MNIYLEQARKIWLTATKYGFNVQINNDILTVSKSFTKGNMEAFIACDIQAPEILLHCPSTSPGSIWGTDGGSVGGHAAVTNGNFRMNKSGCSKRVLNHLSKIITNHKSTINEK